jgi:hypothetical protein
MIYLTKQQLCAIYGPSSVSLERRFNADDSSVHDDTSAAYKYEFGYLQGRCIYAIVQKEQGCWQATATVSGSFEKTTLLRLPTFQCQRSPRPRRSHPTPRKNRQTIQSLSHLRMIL